MKTRIKIYLDTSALNFLFADDAPEKKEITLDFFENFIKTGIYQAFISDFVIQEINQTSDLEKRGRLLRVLDEYYIERLALEDPEEIMQLAKLYIDQKVVPQNKLLDALHIASTVVNKIDYLVSWNYKHLANVNRERKVIIVNTENNYLNPVRILTPIELIDYGS